MVAEVGERPDSDQIYRISWDGSVSDEPGFVAFGGQADQVAATLKERFADGLSLTEALAAALAALAAPAAATSGTAQPAANGNSQPELTAANLEVAILDRARAHRTFRRLHGPRLEELIAESRPAAATGSRRPGRRRARVFVPGRAAHRPVRRLRRRQPALAPAAPQRPAQPQPAQAPARIQPQRPVSPRRPGAGLRPVLPGPVGGSAPFGSAVTRAWC